MLSIYFGDRSYSQQPWISFAPLADDGLPRLRGGDEASDLVKTLQSGLQKELQDNFRRGAIEGSRPGEPDLISNFWTEINRNMSRAGL